MKYPADLATLFARARGLIARRLPLYLVATAVSLTLQVGLLLWHRLDPRLYLIISSAFATAPLAAIVYAFGAADASGMQPSRRATWERIADRIWAVVFIDAALDVLSLGMGVGENAWAVTIFETGILILATVLAFAEVHAVVAEDGNPVMLLPASLLASVRITTTRIGYARAVGLTFVPYLLLQLVAPDLWGVTLLATLMVVPLSALGVVFYLDCQALGHANTGK